MILAVPSESPDFLSVDDFKAVLLALSVARLSSLSHVASLAGMFSGQSLRPFLESLPAK